MHQYKSKLPEMEGVDNIRVDTIQGVLKYKRPGADSKVKWSPPSALRRIDLILVDEASQYDDQVWRRFFQCIKEQPHKPYTVVVADFQQLQPIDGGSFCQKFCERLEVLEQAVELKSVYRSSDQEHLVFLNTIRREQPTRARLEEYFGGRHWADKSLEECVGMGLRMQEQTGAPFAWLTCTNAGASEVCEAALALKGVSAEALRTGYPCDPTSKSELNIVAKRGIVIRLTRNLDKQRGFVNGAIAEVVDSLRGNAVFTARLVGTGNMVLGHPMQTLVF